MCLLSLALTEAAAVAELQHPDGGGGRPQQQLHLSPQRHPGSHQRRDQQGARSAIPDLFQKSCMSMHLATARVLIRKSTSLPSCSSVPITPTLCSFRTASLSLKS